MSNPRLVPQPPWGPLIALQAMLTTEQIESEIEELTREIDTRVAAVRGIFAEVGELRLQTDLLKRLLSMRANREAGEEAFSVMVIGVAGKEDDPLKAICAFCFAGMSESPRDLRFYLRRGWEALVADDLLTYTSDLVGDWRKRIRSDAPGLLAGIRELSMGPIQMMAETAARKSQLDRVLHERLGDFELAPGPTPVPTTRN